MKNKFYSILLILYAILSIYSCDKKKLESNDTSFLKKDSTELNSIKTTIGDTDYIPPKDGKNNRCWYGNRNKKLMNDSNCYFGNGNGYRHRYRGGWRN